MGKARFKPREKYKGKITSAHESVAPAPETLHPVFNLACHKPRYCLSKYSKREKADFANTIHALSRMTWAEIDVAPREGFGYEPIGISQLKPSLPLNLSEDVRIIAFRLSKKGRMAGYRDGNIFYILWFDHTRKLY